MPGGRIDILVAPDLRNFVSQMRSGLAPAVAAAGAVGASLGLAMGAGMAFEKIVKIGNEFTTSLNTMKAVASATADEMAKVSERAKQLGNDASLPGTSASDAAAAMTELAKGGFSVKQSMDAAKGSLQLAAAAQIDAAQAATIQSQALQAFGLKAADAGRVADVLANTANASSAEITDVAWALQSGGAVAKQFGLTIEDTAAAIGLMANSGIKGSDAGTLLKSALLALTDQGKPAREAIHELGLTVYDSSGKFVGLRKLFDQLQGASKKMTPEMYQAATATLFGSDAMRLASIAAEKGVIGYDSLHQAMSRQGSAAAVAAAKMEGLPGAMQKATNAAQVLALGVYDLIKGPLEDFATGAAERIGDATPKITSVMHSAADAAISVGRAVGPVVSQLGDLPPVLYVATAAFVALRATVLGTWLATGAAAIGTAATALYGFGTAAVGVATATGRMIQVATIGQVALGRFGSVIAQLGTHVPVIGRMQSAFMDTSVAASNLARTQGALAAATVGVRSATNGLISLLGGPLVVGVLAAAVAVYTLYSEMKKGSDYAKNLRTSLSEIGKERAALAEIFSLNGGAFDDRAISNVTAQIGTMEKAMEDAGKNTSGFWGKTKGFFTGELQEEFDKNWRADQWKGAKQVMDDLKMSSEQLAATLSDQAAFDTLATKLQGMGTHGRFALSELAALRDEIVKSQAVAKNTTPGFASLSQAVKVLSDESASATDRIDAMKSALDILSGKPISEQQALSKYNAQVRETAKVTAEAWDAAEGFGAALIGQNGQVSTVTENGQLLSDRLNGIRDATIGAAESGANMAPILAQNERDFAALAQAAGLTADQVTVMAAQLGYLPKDIEILASLRGADSVEQQLIVMQGLLRVNGEGVDIPVEALTDKARDKLLEAGVLIDTINAKPGTVHISAPDLPAVNAKLNELIAKNLPDKVQKVKLEYDTSNYSLPVETRQKLHEDISGIPIAPRAEGGIDNLPGEATVWTPQTRLYQVSEPETGGEAFIPLAPAKRSRSTKILSEVAGHFGFGLTKMADGGIALSRAMGFLRGQSGKDYQYGGVGNPSWDCSGFISAAYALLKGLSPYTRWFTTESDFAGLGFKTGQDPTRRGLSVGIYRGGGGQYSHMAGTLAGTPLESGSNGVRVGSGAQSAASGDLPLKFYLPTSSWNPPESSSNSRTSRSSRSSSRDEWDAEKDLELESARISLNKAKSQRDEELKDPKRSADDKRQAEIDVQKAELRVQQLEQQRDQANTTLGPVPEAPELTGDLTDDQIRLEELQLAIRNAREERNEIYDDPAASEDERRAADLSLQKAINSLAAEQKEQREDDSDTSGGSSGYSSPVTLLGNVAKAFVEGQVSDVLNVVGLGGDIGGVTGAAIGIAASEAEKAKKAKPATPSSEELAKQGPVVPGSANWLEELMKTLRIPAVVRDQGGPVPDGTVAINTSGETEWMLTGPQWRSAAAQKAGRTQNVDNRLIIENLNTGMSAGEFQREMKMVEIGRRTRSRALVPR
ncbi:phage tail tape measure protein [Nocardia sp. NPDC050712]|uniref:phage tail tape measure protein n=1 Tax=Nocardia sp. NPDC050712 TaxID=3155518 RepID=UPI00340F61E2